MTDRTRTFASAKEEIAWLRSELWHTSLVLGEIAKWPRFYFHRSYVEEWAIRSAGIFRSFGDDRRADDILSVTGRHAIKDSRLRALVKDPDQYLPMSKRRPVSP